MKMSYAFFGAALAISLGTLPALEANAQAAGRDAIMQRCLQVAKKQWPSDTNIQMTNRTAAYKACMTQAGQRP